MGDACCFPAVDPPHTLIAGLTGTGKSVFLAAWIAALAALSNVALLGIDLKLVELWPWRSRMTRVATTAREADRLFGDLRLLLIRRGRLLQSLGLRKWRPELGPYVVLFIDELAELVAVDTELLAQLLAEGMPDDPDMVKKASELMNQVLQYGQRSQKARTLVLASLARTARFCGVVLVGATQYPSADVIDQQIRTQLGMRVMLRVASGEQVGVCLGQGYSSLIQPTSIGPDEPGGMWVVALPGDPLPVRARSLLVTDDAICYRADQTAALQVPDEVLFGTGDVNDLREAS